MALSAIVWSTLELILGHVSRFLITVVLARLLTPEDFGVIAILSLFIGIAGALIDSGFTPVIIQRRDIDAADMSLILFINLCIALFMCSILVGASSYLALFYDLPILEPLTKLMALNLLISAIGSVHRAVLIKDLSFRLLMVIGASATLSSGALAIYMAVSGYGLWALAAQTLTATSVNTILVLHFVKWRPSLILNRRSARRISDLGGYLLASSILEILYTRIYALLIGKLYGPEELGYYVRADSTTALPMTVTNSILSRVALPLLAASSRDMDALRQNLRVSVQSAMIVNTPAMLGLAVVAESYIHVYSEKNGCHLYLLFKYYALVVC
jgi:teichuronic acid exporter